MPERSNAIKETFEHILRLRRAEGELQPDVREEIVAVREFLEDSIGPTVRPADAARLLGITQPALLRWIKNGEIASVLTPQGRREIPLSELIDLLEEIESVRSDDVGRPVARVMHARRRRAEDIDIDRLLPRSRQRGHRTAELQSLAYHRLVADRLDDRVIDDARRRVRRWRASGRIHPQWVEAWEHVLAMPKRRLAQAITADTPDGRQLRQTSPFAGVLNEHERRRLSRAVEERA